MRLFVPVLQVNAAGNVLLDTFVAQKEAVTDFRTWVSGVTPQHIIGAPSIEEVQKKVRAVVLYHQVALHNQRGSSAALQSVAAAAAAATVRMSGSPQAATLQHTT